MLFLRLGLVVSSIAFILSFIILVRYILLNEMCLCFDIIVGFSECLNGFYIIIVRESFGAFYIIVLFNGCLNFFDILAPLNEYLNCFDDLFL